MSEYNDFFSGYSLQQIHDWYFDLADEIAKRAKSESKSESTAAHLLKYYLTPKAQYEKDKLEQKPKILKFCKEKIKEGYKEDGTPNFFGKLTNEDAGVYIIGDDYLEKIKKHTTYENVMDFMLDIFLSKNDKTLGILGHIKSEGLKKEYKLPYLKSCSVFDELKGVLLGVASKLNSSAVIASLTADQLDVYFGVNTFAIYTEVIICVEQEDKNNYDMFDDIEKTHNELPTKPKAVTVSIKSWKNTIIDYYDFDAARGIPLPNPHYGKKGEGKIHPEIENIPDIGKIKHQYLVNMINKGLAKPFYVYREFNETNPKLLIKKKKINL